MKSIKEFLTEAAAFKVSGPINNLKCDMKLCDNFNEVDIKKFLKNYGIEFPYRVIIKDGYGHKQEGMIKPSVINVDNIGVKGPGEPQITVDFMSDVDGSYYVMLLNSMSEDKDLKKLCEKIISILGCEEYKYQYYPQYTVYKVGNPNIVGYSYKNQAVSTWGDFIKLFRKEYKSELATIEDWYEKLFDKYKDVHDRWDDAVAKLPRKPRKGSAQEKELEASLYSSDSDQAFLNLDITYSVFSPIVVNFGQDKENTTTGFNPKWMAEIAEDFEGDVPGTPVLKLYEVLVSGDCSLDDFVEAFGAWLKKIVVKYKRSVEPAIK